MDVFFKQNVGEAGRVKKEMKATDYSFREFGANGKKDAGGGSGMKAKVFYNILFLIGEEDLNILCRWRGRDG